MTETTDIEKLFRNHYRRLCLYSTHIVKDVDVAEDIVMDQFLKMSELMSNMPNTILNPKSYLYRMTQTASIDYVTHTLHTAKPADVMDLPDDTNGVEERLERESRLWAQIDTLPPACRRILLMSKCRDMKYKDIAVTLGISVKTVEAQMAKAYSILRGKAKEIYMMFF